MLKLKLKNLLRKIGIHIVFLRKLNPIVVNEFHSIKQLLYLRDSNILVAKVPMQFGRSLPCFSYSKDSLHPFVIAARRANISEQNVIEVLKKYYELVTPKNSLEIFDMGFNLDKKEFPSWAVLMPWDCETQAELINKTKKTVEHENKVAGYRLGIEGGWSWLGPTGIKKTKIEANRLLALLKSIKLKGYKRSNEIDGDIIANILIGEKDNWVWQSISGQHRASILSALGYETVYVRINKFIRREDVEHWPNVVNGFYTKQEALKIFDMIFDSDFNHLIVEWRKYLKEMDLL